VTSVVEREFTDGAADSGAGARTRKARTS